MRDFSRRDASMTAERDDLACIELVELVTEYLDGALAPGERSRVDRHLAGCDGCATYMDQIRQTIAAAGSLGPDDVPAPVMARLLAVFREAHDAGSGG
jgi:anti-sigma factor RsiW